MKSKNVVLLIVLLILITTSFVVAADVSFTIENENGTIKGNFGCMRDAEQFLAILDIRQSKTQYIQKDGYSDKATPPEELQESYNERGEMEEMGMIKMSVILIIFTAVMYLHSRYRKESKSLFLNIGQELFLGTILIYSLSLSIAHYSWLLNDEMLLLVILMVLIMCGFTVFGWIFKKEKT